MKTKTLSFILVLLLLTSFLAGCGKSGGEATSLVQATATATLVNVLPAASTQASLVTPTAGPSQTTLTIWHSWDDDELAIFQDILKNFQEDHPEVQFDVLYIPPENIGARVKTEILEGGGPDLFFGPAEWGPALYQAGALADLTNDVKDSLRTAINPAALAAATYQDALVGLPYALQGVVLYRNKNIIPRSPVTFDELVAMAKAATQGEIIGADLERGFFFSGGHLNGIGGELISPEGDPLFNSEFGLAWLDLLKAFEAAGPTENLSDRDIELFKEGRVGWIIDGTWNLQSLVEALGAQNLAIDPWPSYHGGSLSGYVQASNIYLSSMTAAPDRQAALNFIDYFLSTESQARLTEVGLIPAVRGAKVADPLLEALISQAMTALAGGAPYPTHPDFPVYLAPLDQALQSFFNGSQPPAEALRIAQEAIKVALAQIRATATPAP